jgi:DNA-binding PadR family transcriptional regulator
MSLRLLILGVIAYLLAKMVQAGLASRGRANAIGSKPRRQMIRCASCGVYVLRDRALPAADGTSLYCSPDCAGK